MTNYFLTLKSILSFYERKERVNNSIYKYFCINKCKYILLTNIDKDDVYNIFSIIELLNTKNFEFLNDDVLIDNKLFNNTDLKIKIIKDVGNKKIVFLKNILSFILEKSKKIFIISDDEILQQKKAKIFNISKYCNDNEIDEKYVTNIIFKYYNNIKNGDIIDCVTDKDKIDKRIYKFFIWNNVAINLDYYFNDLGTVQNIFRVSKNIYNPFYWDELPGIKLYYLDKKYSNELINNIYIERSKESNNNFEKDCYVSFYIYEDIKITVYMDIISNSIDKIIDMIEDDNQPIFYNKMQFTHLNNFLLPLENINSKNTHIMTKIEKK